MINRRDVLLKAPLLAAVPASAFALPLGADQRTDAPVRTKDISPAVLAAVSTNFMNTIARAHRGNLSQADVMSTASMMNLLRNHFTEVGFDEMFKQALKAVVPETVDFTSAPTIESAYEEFHRADSTFTLEEVRQSIAQIAQPENVPLQIAELKAHGITPSLAAVEQYLNDAAQSLPVAFNPRTNRAHLQRVSVCGRINFYAGLVGIAGGLLGNLAGAGAFELASENRTEG